MKRKLLVSIFILCMILPIFGATGHASTYCYQETPNVSTSCGGLSTGDYYLPNQNTEPVYVNYSKPPTAISASWQVYYGLEGITNISIPQSCWDADSEFVMLRMNSELVAYRGMINGSGDCYNGTDWERIAPEMTDDLTLWCLTRDSTICVQSGGGVYTKLFDGLWDYGLVYRSWWAQIKKLSTFQVVNGSWVEEAIWWELVPPTGILNVSTSNESDNTPLVDTYQLREDFYTFADWQTIQGTAITNATGICEVTYDEIIREVDSISIGNITLCNHASCDYQTFTEDFNNAPLSGLTSYNAYIDICYEQLQPTNDIHLNITCASGSTTADIPVSTIPDCDDTTLFYLLEGSGVCGSDDNVTINIYNSHTQNRRVQITDLGLDQVRNNPSNNLTYNTTLQLWELNHSHTQHTIGTYNINVTCTDTINGDYTKTDTHTYTYYSYTPQIFFNTIETDCNNYNLTDNLVVEYCSGAWNWYGSIVDQDADWLNVTWLDNESNILHTNTGDPLTTNMITPDELFMEFKNPYTLYVWVNDSEGHTAQENLTIYVNDTTAPVVTIHSPEHLAEFEDETITFNATCVDEATYSVEYLIYDMNGSVLFNHTVLDLNQTNYNNYTSLSTSAFSGSTTQTDYANYTVSCADAHTQQSITAYVEDTAINKKKYHFGNSKPVEVEVDPTDLIHFTTTLENDRYTFDIKYGKVKDKLKFTVYGTNVRHIKSEYACHIVLGEGLGEVWFDAEPYKNCHVMTLKDRAVITIFTDSKIDDGKTFKTKSIGVVNTAVESVQFTVNPQLNCEYDSTPYIKSTLLMSDRHLIPLLCKIKEATNKTFKCTTKVYNGEYLLQANPDTKYDDRESLTKFVTTNRHFGYFTPKPENQATQNVLLYYTNEGLRDERTANVTVDCVSGATHHTYTKEITPQYKDLFETIDVLDKAKQNTPYLIISVIFVVLLLSIIIYFIRKAKKEFRP